MDSKHATEAPRERLARYIARSGIASRRTADRLVREGQATVNGQVERDPGFAIDPEHDDVRLQGRPIEGAREHIYQILYKPRGTITSREDPEGRKGVHELLPKLPDRVEPVGRLDFNTEGALLFTNDGDLAHRLTHPSYHIPRRYLAKVYRTPSEATLDKIRKGIRLDDGRTVPALCRVTDSTDTGNAWVEITVYEGRHHLIRRLFAALGHPVSKLRRESFATVSIRGMERGDSRPLSPAEIERIRELTATKGASGRVGSKSTRKKGWARPAADKDKGKPLSKAKRNRTRKRRANKRQGKS
jgi:23S rRNA pseudouridine2605 synthase